MNEFAYPPDYTVPQQQLLDFLAIYQSVNDVRRFLLKQDCPACQEAAKRLDTDAYRREWALHPHITGDTP